MEKVTIDEAALKARVGDLAYEVLRNAATERPFTGEYTDTELVGSYRCKACNAELFKSETKFHSGCGWPGDRQGGSHPAGSRCSPDGANGPNG